MVGKTRLGALLVAVLVTSMPSAARAAAPAACPDEPTAAVACFVNAARESQGLRPLRIHPALTRSATRYARRLAAESWLGHVTPEGEDAADRMLAAGYGSRRHDRPWSGAEALGLGTGELGTPQAMVLGWLASASHRRIVLGRWFKHLGIGIGAIDDGLPGAVYVLHVGERRTRAAAARRRG